MGGCQTSIQHSQLFENDQSFCRLYPPYIRQLDKIHWSPLAVTRRVAKFLVAGKNIKVLDIGSGAGKFCLAAAFYQPSGFFCGVEQRQNLIELALMAKEKLGYTNVDFLHRNFTQVNFREFDAFFFYNSFFENVPGSERIDESLSYSLDLYLYYSRYLCKQLKELPVGTKLATYCSWEDEIPEEFVVVEEETEDHLKLWKKTS